ncbi:hypothetical protein FRB95_013401 [Tulasnella sp. JGI-2019a]|nr:hypothetical protein FRB95_013401 [Tulasnella sp. JGI-2019a]
MSRLESAFRQSPDQLSSFYFPPMSNLSYGGALRIGNLLCVILGGFYVCLFAVTIWVLRSKRVSLFSPVSGIVTLIFICNMSDVVGVIYTMYKVYVLFPEGPDMYIIIAILINPDAKWTTAAGTFFATAAYSGDLLMAWRLYIIW